MNDFDDRLRGALSEEDAVFDTDLNVRDNYYAEVFASFRGPDAIINIAVWVGVFLGAGLTILFLVLAFRADYPRDLILYCALAVMTNSGQIALQLWFNSRMDRRAVVREINRLRLDLLGREARRD